MGAQFIPGGGRQTCTEQQGFPEMAAKIEPSGIYLGRGEPASWPRLTLWWPVVSCFLLFIGSILFALGSALLNSHDTLATWADLVGSSVFFISSSGDMCRAFTGVQRDAREKAAAAATADGAEVGLLYRQQPPKSEVPTRQQLADALFLPAVYLTAACCFVSGSVLWLPEVVAVATWLGTLGTWIFRCGSSLYIVGSVGNFYKLYGPLCFEHKKVPGKPFQCTFLAWLWTVVYTSYTLGSSLFITGGALFSMGWSEKGAIAWFGGSVLFIIGSGLSLCVYFVKAVTAEAETKDSAASLHQQI